MIAACPRCAARYRIEKEKLRPEGVKLRCSRCQAVFRVRPPHEAADSAADVVGADATAVAPAPTRRVAPVEVAPAPEPAPAAAPAADATGDLVLVALPDAELAKRTEETLRSWGLRTACVSDGVEAILEIQRQLPRAALLSAALPRMYGFQICELVKRNESLRGIGVVLIGSIHHPDRYRRPPNELYGADVYVEEPDLPDGLRPALERLGLGTRRGGAPPERLARGGAVPAAPLGDEAPTAARAVPSRPAAPARGAPAPVAPAVPAPLRDDGLDEQRAKAERLARIIVSDIVLYNEEKFAAAIRKGNVLAVLGPDLEEGRALFRERIDARVRGERDHLADELQRVARARA